MFRKVVNDRRSRKRETETTERKKGEKKLIFRPKSYRKSDYLGLEKIWKEKTHNDKSKET